MGRNGMRKTFISVVAVTVLAGWAATASAQSRPLVTEDPETVGAGQILFESGVEYQQGLFYPASGLKGNLWRVPSFGFSFGVSSIAEIQLDGGVRDLLTITSRTPAPLSDMLTVTGNRAKDFPDAVIGAKIRFASETERRPAMAVKFWTRLPNEGNESGLGLDTTDFNFGLAVGKTVQSIRVVGNFGFGILGNPVRGDVQNDVFNYGLSVARAVRTGVEVVGEVNGRVNTRNGTPPVGTESRGQMRLGGRLTRGPVRLDAAFIAGMTQRDATWGFTTGLTWVFHAFNVP